MSSAIDFYNQYLAKLQSKAEEAVKDAIEKSYAEYFAVADEKLRDIYEETINDFYDKYPRSFYKPRGSLYRLIETKHGKDYLEIWFEPSRISYRNGYAGENGLYEYVFRQGWHGGADIDGNMLVPWTSPPMAYDGDTAPWSSKPWQDQQISHGWKPAKQASISPLDDFKNRVDKYHSSEYQQDYQKIWNKYKASIRINMS